METLRKFAIFLVCVFAARVTGDSTEAVATVSSAITDPSSNRSGHDAGMSADVDVVSVSTDSSRSTIADALVTAAPSDGTSMPAVLSETRTDKASDSAENREFDNALLHSDVIYSDSTSKKPQETVSTSTMSSEGASTLRASTLGERDITPTAEILSSSVEASTSTQPTTSVESMTAEPTPVTEERGPTTMEPTPVAEERGPTTMESTSSNASVELKSLDADVEFKSLEESDHLPDLDESEPSTFMPQEDGPVGTTTMSTMSSTLEINGETTHQSSTEPTTSDPITTELHVTVTFPETTTGGLPDMRMNDEDSVMDATTEGTGIAFTEATTAAISEFPDRGVEPTTEGPGGNELNSALYPGVTSTEAAVLTSTDEIKEQNYRKEKQLGFSDTSGPCPCKSHGMSSDVSQCLGHRMVPDPSCPCQNVCARQATQLCNDSLPCDEDFGLHCVPETGTCQGDLDVQVFDVTHNSAKLRWGLEKSELHPQAAVAYTTAYRGSHTQWTEVEPSKPITSLENLLPNNVYFVKVEEDGKQEVTVFQTLDGCIYNATLSFGVGEKFNFSCNETCTCYSGGEPVCHNRCYYVPVDIRHSSCVEVPDENDPCCVRLQCTDDAPGNLPKLLITQVSPSTITVVWDDFRLPSYHSEYVLEYQPADSNSDSWTKVQAGSQPIVTVMQLKPNTSYRVRVSVWEDGSKKLERPSEVVTVRTKDGCVKNNRTYSVGDEFFHGCDLRCICEGGDRETCSPRCNPPYIKIGTKPDDPACYEKPIPSDPCCVMVRCTEGKSIDSTNEGDQQQNKPGECPEIVEESLSTAKSCMSDCDHDGDCSGTMKCCPSSCGGAVCVQPIVVGDICENIYCGPNAKCVAEKMACECMEGYDGHPHDFLNGCKPKGSFAKSPSSPQNVTEVVMSSTEQPPASSEMTTSPVVTVTVPVSTEAPPETSSHSSGPTTEPPFELDLGSVSPHLPMFEEDAPMIPENNSAAEESGIPEAIDAFNDTDARNYGPLKEVEDEDINTTYEEDRKDAKKKLPSDVPVPFDGCEFNNITYDRGVRFDDGCEARCICDGPGHVTCVPRCSVLSSGGKDCREVPDPDDSCCKIMVCNFPGSDDIGSVDELSLKILSAQPQNGTTVRIRLALTSAMMPTMVGQESLEVWYAMADGGESNLSQWNKRPIVMKELTEVQQGIYEFDVNDLMPDKDYFFKVAKERQDSSKLHMAEFSNTVSAKTFPAAVKTVFQGCFHHNQSYSLGEIFYQGCEFKCICRENGYIECQDRCEIYIDTVGYENCDWVPSEEDPCCMIPSCQRRKIPLMPGSRMPPFVGPVENMCVVNSDEFYRVGDIWELHDGCKMKICRCALLPNGTTAIQCQSECPTLPPNAHIPTARCPNPVLVKPDGPCSCPYISCTDPPPRRLVQPPQPQCEFKGKRYDVGQEFHDGCIALCHCGQDLRVSCAAIECPYHFSAEFTNCLEWDIDPDFFPTPPHCCAPSKCKNDGSCIFSGRKFLNFADIPSDLLPCGARCVCVNGNVTCENRCPPVEDVPPPNLPCSPSLAYKGNPPGETCCLRWMCKEPPKQAYCLFQGSRYMLSEQWEVRKGTMRRLCSCHMDSSGSPRVECKGGCPQIPQRFILPSEQCAHPVIVTPDDPVMCPYVVCNNSVTAQELYNVNVVALNSTAVRVRFTLANILVGLVGHAELHFTTDPTLPSSEWHVQKFSRPKRLFDSPNIEYILNALRPNTTYFLQVKIKIDALQGGPESEMFKLKMPPEISTVTTTTTVPPVIMLDAKPEAHVIDANTARISWRNFEPQEKKYIYAVQLKYKKAFEGSDKWITTPMIHRDVTSYFLHDLEPSTSYTVDMIFTPPKEFSTKLVSVKSLDFQTMGKTKEDYSLHVSVDENKLDSESTEFDLDGIPQPITKFVHVVKITYKTPDGKQLYSFKVPKSNKIELDHLEPGKKYLAQMELYLTNGHTLTSNEVEFITKAAKSEAGSSVEVNAVEGSHANGKQAELLQSKEAKVSENSTYFIALVVVAVVAAVAGFGFVLLLVILVRRQASAKAPISRTPSESAYDNPTYKTYDGERLEDKTNGQAIQTTQA